jgi:hypothetical protein
MKLSNETLNILKNFSTINQNLEVKAGNKLTTVSATKTVLAKATLKEDFPQDFCVYDLNQFLLVYSMFKDNVELGFDDHNVIFKSGRKQSKYRKASRDTIVTPPEKEIKLTHVDYSFKLSESDYSDILKAANVLSSPNIALKSDGKDVILYAYDANDDAQHSTNIDVGTAEGQKFNIVFKTENLKMLAGSYDVQISFKGLAHFKNTKDDIQYWIAIEGKESTY